MARRLPRRAGGLTASCEAGIVGKVAADRVPSLHMTATPLRPHRMTAKLLLAIALTAAASTLPCQDQLRTWGWAAGANDSEIFNVQLRNVSVGLNSWTLGLTREGRLVSFGGSSAPPEPPPGLSYVNAWASSCPVGELSDGSLVQWVPFAVGTTPPTSAPALPVGMRWVEVDSTRYRAFAIRSDGTLHSWGSQAAGVDLVPPLAPGLSYVSLAASRDWMSALVSDGTIRVWGQWALTWLTPIPPLPPGVTYTRIAAGWSYVLALRSDGQIVAWGDNSGGQCNVPALPPGTTYVTISAGASHSVALRSDGQYVLWGWDSVGEISDAPAVMDTFVEVLAGSQYTVGVRADGRIESWGQVAWHDSLKPRARYTNLDAFGSSALTLASTPGRPTTFSTNFLGQSWAQSWANPSPLPFPLYFTSIRASPSVVIGLVNDGTLRAFSNSNFWGQLNIPPLPPNLTYTSIDVGDQNAVAIRSDGSAVGWGQNNFGQATIPPLPPGLTYIAAAAGEQNVLLLRSDGTITMAGTGGTQGLTTLPNLPPGLRFTDVACGKDIAAALRSDGMIVAWGSYTAVPVLPAGVSYVEVRIGDRHAVARRSDGTAVTWGVPNWDPRVTTPPILPAGRSYLRVAATWEGNNAALIGSESRYVGFAAGCAGSAPASRIVPRDTPQIGRTFPALLTNLPSNLALLAFGWNPQPPVPLDPLGMPGCTAHIAVDSVVTVSGVGEARFELPIPLLPTLLGQHFYNQAFVLDPAANPLGAVVSEAMEGVIGG